MSPTPTRTSAAALQQAWDALARYEPGASRAALIPIDEVVRAALTDAALRVEVEQRFVLVLRGTSPSAAKEYACSKLTMIGSAEAVSALASLLTDPALAHAAINSLQAIPAPEASRALQNNLPRLGRLAKVGAITALGMRRDQSAVPALAKWLRDPDPEISGAAAAALGEIGNQASARLLRSFLAEAPLAVRPAVLDACLACAKALLAAANTAAARVLMNAVLSAAPPPLVRAAALRLSAAGVH